MRDLDDSTMEYVFTGISQEFERLFGSPGRSATGTSTASSTGSSISSRAMIYQNASDTIDPTDTEGLNISITEVDQSDFSGAIRMPHLLPLFVLTVIQTIFYL